MTSGHPRSADVATLIDRYDAALNAHDLDAIASMHDDAIVFHNHTARERFAGATAGRAHIGAIFARWPARRLRAARSGPRVPCTPTTGANWNGAASTSSPPPRRPLAQKRLLELRHAAGPLARGRERLLCWLARANAPSGAGRLAWIATAASRALGHSSSGRPRVLLAGEAVAQTGQQPGASIARRTTVVKCTCGEPWCGTTPPKRHIWRAGVPPSSGQRRDTGLRDSLRRERKRHTSSMAPLPNAALHLIEDAVRAGVKHDQERLRRSRRKSEISTSGRAQYRSHGTVDLVMPPGSVDEWPLDVYDVDAGSKHIIVDMWTEQEGRSDLSLELALRQAATGVWETRVLDLHVL